MPVAISHTTSGPTQNIRCQILSRVFRHSKLQNSSLFYSHRHFYVYISCLPFHFSLPYFHPAAISSHSFFTGGSLRISARIRDSDSKNRIMRTRATERKTRCEWEELQTRMRKTEFASAISLSSGRLVLARKDLCRRSTLSCSLSRLITDYDTTLACGRWLRPGIRRDNRPCASRGRCKGLRG